MERLQNLLWLVMALSTILPMLRTFMNNMRRKQLIAKLERDRGSKVITMVFAQVQHKLCAVGAGR